MDTDTATLPTHSPLTLSKMRNGDKRGTFRHEGHEITVVVTASDKGRYNAVRACSSTHPGLGPVLASVGLLIKCGVGRYTLSQAGQTPDRGYTDRGTVADLAERLVRSTV